MNKKTVVLVAFQEQDNLGIGYIASILLEADFDVKIVDFRIGKENILKHLIQFESLVIGFSIIFQYHLHEFKDLITYLRDNGVQCHFSAGGHFPSLRYNEVLHIVPQLDSIVLFEGEYTFFELVSALDSGREWHHIRSIAYREKDRVFVNPLRPLEKDLDEFPPPTRQPLKKYVLGKKYATILAGRGCYYNCSFCSIREFYSKPPGSLKRLRRPEMVVREMELLFHQKDCRVFMFQDDDFPIAGKKGREWVINFCRLLEEKDLKNRILWKINCRPDEIDVDILKLMKDSGLFLLYLGIESGTDEGMRLMNKHMTIKKIKASIKTLKSLNLKFDFGFMLFDPSSSYQSISDNIDFLEEIIGDGFSPVTYCKMLPYVETAIERKLKSEGKLKVAEGFEDYDFSDVSLDHLFSFMQDCFSLWIGQHGGLLNVSRWARYNTLVYQKYYLVTPAFNEVDKLVDTVISQSNRYFFDTVRKLIALFSTGKYRSDQDSLSRIKAETDTKHTQFITKLCEAIKKIEHFAEKKEKTETN